MPRWLVLLVLLPQCTGCLCYAYPTLTQTPELAVENHDGGAHAFRVDIDRTERKSQPTVTEYTLMRIPMDTRGIVPTQVELAAAFGVYNPLGLGDTKEHERTDYTMTIRFYKPGFQTMEVRAWDKSRPLQWVPAPDLAAQEKAIDDLLADPAAPDAPGKFIATSPVSPSGTHEPQPRLTWWEQKDQKSPRLGLQAGSVSVSQRETLKFAATEYGRLANTHLALTPNMQPIQQRLQQKAIWLQRWAVQPPAVVEVR